LIFSTDVVQCLLAFFDSEFRYFLRTTAAIAVTRRSHRNSVRPSVRHTLGSVKSGAS